MPADRDGGDRPSPEDDAPMGAVITGDGVLPPGSAETGDEPARSARRRGGASSVLGLLALSAVIAVLVRLVLVQSFVIPSGSMQETLQIGDRVLVSRLDYRFGPIRRGDVVVFDGTGAFDPAPTPPRSELARLGRAVASGLGMPVGQRDYVKRVIGLPGDRVVCCTSSGAISVNGAPLSEPYLHPGDAPSDLSFDVVVPAGRLWVMGDHREDSADSREHVGDPGGGTVPEDQVIGRVGAVWWPIGRAQSIARVDPVVRPQGGQELQR